MPASKVKAPSAFYSPDRRQFLHGFGAGAALLSLRWAPQLNAASSGSSASVPELRGTQFALTIGEQRVNYSGLPRIATTINGSIPAPTLRWREGDTVTLKVTNQLRETSSIHWHGIILPPQMDGVPGISFAGIAPGETFTYRFKLNQSGTYWYHSHSGFQEQTGMYGGIVITPRDGEPIPTERDYVIVLSDWSDEDPNAIYAKLKKLSHYYNFNERTLGELWQEIKTRGVAATWQDRQMWNQMRMSDRDLSDVTGYTYTFLINGQPPSSGWFGAFKPGEKVRLRFINSAAMTFFDVRIPGLKMRVVATDGQDIEPVSVDEFRIGVAETYDVIVEPDDAAYTLFAQAFDRSGYALGTLAPDPDLRAEIPPLDPLPILGHQDMGMAMDHGMHAGMDHAAMGHAPATLPAVDPDLDMAGMQMGGMTMESRTLQEMDMSSLSLADDTRSKPISPLLYPDHSKPVSHARSEYGPHVDMRADAPVARLDDPGVGLRNNGRRVLTYADLFNRHATPDPRPPQREIELHLTGNMSRYMWSINGIKFADAEPLRLRYGERVRITLVNDTMMNHPMHLHGMWSDLETGDVNKIPRKHTVVVQPGARISYLVTADARGDWAYHCHLIFHMLGMFRRVSVS